MLDDLRSRDTLSRDMRRLSNELREATRKLESQLGRTPDNAESVNHRHLAAGCRGARRLAVGVREAGHGIRFVIEEFAWPRELDYAGKLLPVIRAE